MHLISIDKREVKIFSEPSPYFIVKIIFQKKILTGLMDNWLDALEKRVQQSFKKEASISLVLKF